MISRDVWIKYSYEDKYHYIPDVGFTLCPDIIGGAIVEVVQNIEHKKKCSHCYNYWLEIRNARL